MRDGRCIFECHQKNLRAEVMKANGCRGTRVSVCIRVKNTEEKGLGNMYFSGKK